MTAGLNLWFPNQHGENTIDRLSQRDNGCIGYRAGLDFWPMAQLT